MIDQEILNIRREDRDESTIKHHYMDLRIQFFGSMVDKDQFVKNLKKHLTDVLISDYEFDTLIDIQEVSTNTP